MCLFGCFRALYVIAGSRIAIASHQIGINRTSQTSAFAWLPSLTHSYIHFNENSTIFEQKDYWKLTSRVQAMDPPVQHRRLNGHVFALSYVRFAFLVRQTRDKAEGNNNRRDRTFGHTVDMKTETMT